MQCRRLIVGTSSVDWKKWFTYQILFYLIFFFYLIWFLSEVGVLSGDILCMFKIPEYLTRIGISITSNILLTCNFFDFYLIIERGFWGDRQSILLSFRDMHLLSECILPRDDILDLTTDGMFPIKTVRAAVEDQRRYDTFVIVIAL